MIRDFHYGDRYLHSAASETGFNALGLLAEDGEMHC
ncbi:hypothetical protein T10_8405 [Trichinella papuae]|uniref:Uncharacterized protein n=1 Tax=Trichinella papuae TaxID=268474 RepID=A0A0V1LYI2_9BILA|nr:hypothetical protein T10_8405 [Trichinella papuae]